MISDTVIIGFISLVGTLGGSILGIVASTKLTTFRIEQLEKKVDAHNQLVDRMYRVEEDIKLLDQRVDNLEQ